MQDHLISGLSFDSFGGVVLVSRETLYNWTRKHKEFLDTKKQYTPACQLFWEKMGRSGAAGQVPGFNTGAWIFNMKNRFNWTDKKEIEHSGAPELILNYKLDE